MIDLPVLSYQLEYDDYQRILVTLDMARGINGVIRWAIREKGDCLNKDGKWEYEPLNSSRTEEFFARCRWDTAEEALKFWRDGKFTSQFRRAKQGHLKNICEEQRS
jgi:hypothetical protein